MQGMIALTKQDLIEAMEHCCESSVSRVGTMFRQKETNYETGESRTTAVVILSAKVQKYLEEHGFSF